jgi:hypothetical protein
MDDRIRLPFLTQWTISPPSGPAPVTVVETPEFLAVSRKLMDETDRAELVDYLAHNPTAGDLIPGTGGVRKLRWGLEGRGKRGGARVIYFYHNPGIPLFALTAYAKNERADLTAADRNDFRRLTKLLVETFEWQSTRAR